MQASVLRALTRFNHSHTRLLLLVALCGLGFALRLHRLDFHALWWDEGITVYFAPLDPVAMARAAAVFEDLNPPAYRLAVGLWMRLVGPMPFSVRYVSLICGLLVVPLVWTVGRRTVGPGAAAIGATLAATGPALIYYSQEAKGYTFVALAVWLAHAFWLNLSRSGNLTRPREWLRRQAIAYAATITAALAAHYIAIFNAAADGLWALLSAWLRRDRGRLLVVWTLSLALALSVVLAYAEALLHETATGLEHTSEGYFARSLPAYIGIVAKELASSPVVSPAGIFAAIGLALLGLGGALSSEGHAKGRGLVVVWLLVPLALGYLFQRVYPFFFPRFLLYIVPALYLLAGAGLIALRRRIRAAGALMALILIVLNLASLNPIYTRPDNPDEDYRPLIAHLAPLTRPGDVVLYAYVWQVGYLQSYLPGNNLVFELIHYAPDSYKPDLIDPELSLIAREHARIWHLGYGGRSDDPTNLVAHWLKTHLLRAELHTFGKTELALYVRPDATSPPLSGEGPVERATFGPAIALDYTPISVTVRPGDVVGVPFTWRALASPGMRYAVFVHVRDADGYPLIQNDGDPVNGDHPTDLWRPGDVIADPHILLVRADMPPGRYPVFVGLYDRDTGTRVPVQDVAGQPLGDSLLVGTVEVVPR